MPQNWFERNAPQATPKLPSVTLDLEAPLPEISAKPSPSGWFVKNAPRSKMPKQWLDEKMAPVGKSMAPVATAFVDAAKALGTKENAALIAAGILYPPAAVAAGLYFLPKMLEGGADVYALELDAERQASEAKDGKTRQQAERDAKYWKTMRYITAGMVGAGAYGTAKYAGAKLDKAVGRTAIDVPPPRGPRSTESPLESWFRKNHPEAAGAPAEAPPRAQPQRLTDGTELPPTEFTAQPAVKEVAPVLPVETIPAQPEPKAVIPETEAVIPETKPLKTETKTGPTIETFTAARDTLRAHPARGNPSRDSGPEYARPKYEERLKAGAANATPEDLEAYLSTLRETAETYLPHDRRLYKDIRRADEALEAGNGDAFALAAEAAYHRISTGWHEQMTAAAAKKAGIELPNKRPPVQEFGPDIQVRTGTQGTTVWLGGVSRDILGKFGEFGGLAMNRDDMLAIKVQLNELIASDPKHSHVPLGKAIIAAFDEAAARTPEGEHIRLISSDFLEPDGGGRARVANVIRHEAAHAAALANAKYSAEGLDALMAGHADQDIRNLYKNSFDVFHADHPEKYSTSPSTRGNEMLALVISGDTKSLKLPREDVSELAVSMYEALSGVIGEDGASKVFRRAHPLVKKAILEWKKKPKVEPEPTLTIQEFHDQAAAAQQANKGELPAEPTVVRSPAHKAMVREGAIAEAQAWADAARHAQERLKPGESAMTMESNAGGKELEEMATAEASRVGRSLGVKEGSPLEGFRESPSKLIEAIDKKSGKLYDRILEAMEGPYDETYGDRIAEYLEMAEKNNGPQRQGGLGGSKDLIGAEDADDITFDFGDEKGAVRIDLVTRPVHTIRQAIYEATERFGEAGLRKAGLAIGRAFEKLPAGVQEAASDLFGSRTEKHIQYRRELRGETAENKEAVETIGQDLIKALPTREAQVLAAKLAQNTATPEEIIEAMNDPVIQAAAQFVKDDFTRLGELIIAEGVGKYAKVPLADRLVLIDVIKGVRSIEDLAPEFRPLTEMGIAKFWNEYLPRLYRSKEAKAILKKFGVSGTRVRNEFSRLEKRNEELSPEVRAAMGEITEIVYPAVKGIFQEEMMLTKNRFFIKIAADPTLAVQPGKPVPPRWRTLPVSDLLGPLSGVAVEPGVYRDMMDIVKAPAEANAIVKTLKELGSFTNRWVKKFKTTWNPAGQSRNYQSNIVTRDAGGMDFTSQAYRDPQAFRDILKKGHWFKEARHVGLFDTDYTTLELGKYQMDDVMPEVPQRRQGISGAYDAMAKILQAAMKIDHAASWGYKMGDDVPKLGMYIWLREQKGMTPKQAVKRVLDVLPDYAEAAPIVDKLRNSLLAPTFMRYSSIMWPRWASMTFKHPVRAGKYVVLGHLVKLGLVAAALKTYQELTDEQKEMPEYTKPKGPGGVMAPVAPTGMQDSQGRHIYWDLTYTLGFGDVMEGSGMFGLPPVFDMGILPRTMLSLNDNRDDFSSYIRGEGVDIWKDTDSARTKGLKFGRFLGGQLLPTWTPAVGYGYRRLESSIKRTPSYYGDAPQDRGLAMLQVLGGIKTIAIDKDTEGAARLRQRDRKIRNIEGEIQGVRRNQGLSDSARDKELDRLQRDIDRVIEAYEKR